MHDFFGDDAVVVICVAHTGAAYPAEEIASTVADLLFTQGDDLCIGKMLAQGIGNVHRLWVVCVGTIENKCFHWNILFMYDEAY